MRAPWREGSDGGEGDNRLKRSRTARRERTIGIGRRVLEIEKRQRASEILSKKRVSRFPLIDVGERGDGSKKSMRGTGTGFLGINCEGVGVSRLGCPFPSEI